MVTAHYHFVGREISCSGRFSYYLQLGTNKASMATSVPKTTLLPLCHLSRRRDMEERRVPENPPAWQHSEYQVVWQTRRMAFHARGEAVLSRIMNDGKGTGKKAFEGDSVEREEAVLLLGSRLKREVF